MFYGHDESDINGMGGSLARSTSHRFSLLRMPGWVLKIATCQHLRCLNNTMCCYIGGYTNLVAQLQTIVAMRQQQTAKTLQAWMHGSQSKKDAMIAASALPLLITLLRSAQPAVQRPAVCASYNLTLGSQQNKDDFIAAGVAPLLIALLRSEQPAVLKPAVHAVLNLADSSQQDTDAASAGPLLLALLRSKQPIGACSICFVESCNWLSTEQGCHHCNRRWPCARCPLSSEPPTVQEPVAYALFSLTNVS